MQVKERGHKKLVAWQKADELAFAVYNATRSFPKEELYGLTSQLRRAALSVPTNIAEGMGRQNKNEMKQFVNIALGSLAEVEYLMEFSKRLQFINEGDYAAIEKLRQNTGNLLFGLYRSLK